MASYSTIINKKIKSNTNKSSKSSKSSKMSTKITIMMKFNQIYDFITQLEYQIAPLF